MRITTLFFLNSVLFFHTQVKAQSVYDAYGKPLIALQEMYIFGLGIPNPEIPTFILYEKGQVLYTVDSGCIPSFYQVTLSQKELQSFIEQLAITDSIYNLKDHFIAVGASCIGDNTLTISLSQEKKIAVQGYLGDNGIARKNTPVVFLALYDKIRKYSNPKATRWSPDRIEVLFENYEDYYDDTLKKVTWPLVLPDLNDSTSIFSNDTYTISIGRRHFDEFTRFYYSLVGVKAVEINGKRMLLSYRVRFPNNH